MLIAIQKWKTLHEIQDLEALIPDILQHLFDDRKIYKNVYLAIQVHSKSAI